MDKIENEGKEQKHSNKIIQTKVLKVLTIINHS